MVLRLPEPDLTPLTLKGDPGVGVQGPPGQTGPPGLKVSLCPIPSGRGSGQGSPGGGRKRAFFFFKDLLGFIEQFMKWAASHLVIERCARKRAFWD